MEFHLDWHDAQYGRGKGFFEEAADEPSLEQLLTVMAALRALRKATPRAQFVADLRARLTVEARKQLAAKRPHLVLHKRD